jgi:hypothetical protein
MAARSYLTYSLWQKSFAWLAMSSLLAMLLTNMLYRHAHIGNRGTLIVHAHPYKADKETGAPVQHSHSDAEIIFLGQLANPAFLLSLVLVFAGFLLFGGQHRNGHYLSFSLQHSRLSANPLRGPPSFV